MIDIDSEELLSFSQASKRLRTRPHVSTIWRWAATGGLETVRLGGRVYTSIEAIERFAEHRDGRLKAPKHGPTAKRQHEIEHAERQLARAGIGEQATSIAPACSVE